MTTEPIAMDIPAGESIERACADMATRARREDCEIIADFNGIQIRATPRSSIDDLIAKWRRDADARAEAWRNSPEGQQAKRDAAGRLAFHQDVANRCLHDLTRIDITDLRTAIDWLDAFQEPSDFRGALPNGAAARVAAAFESAGYVAGENCGAAFRGDDRENVGRWWVGQCIDHLRRVGAIHEMMRKFAREWREKFEPLTAPPDAG